MGTAMAMDAPDDPEADTRHDLTLDINSAPHEENLAIISLDLPGPMSTAKGFKMTASDDQHFHVVIDTTLTHVIVDPEASKKKPDLAFVKPVKKGKPKLTIKGTLDIYCPPRAE